MCSVGGMKTRTIGSTQVPDTHMSLASVGAGDRFAIRQIFFDEVRERCAMLALHEGDVAQCRAVGSGTLLIDTDGGRTVELARGWACFIEVSRAAAEDVAIHGH